MSDESLPLCPQCGTPLPANAPAGLCPSCLMALNLRTETVFTDDKASAQLPLPPEQIAPHFPQLEILECLGRGGMGVVYKARQKTLNRFVALKLLAPERVGDAKFAERFAREAQALAALNHPNIVTIHDFGQAGGFYFLLMEFVDGVNLRQLLRTRKFSPEEALAIVPPLCDALQFAHDRCIVHRDIKPENLLLDKEGRVKVADFGIAKMLGAQTPLTPALYPSEGAREAKPGERQAATGDQALGTPGYSAPEQKTDPQQVDSRADIYSLGVVFYELLTGELPGKPLQPPSKKVQIDVRLDEIVLRALEQKPELRYQQASALKTQVETIATSPAAKPGPPAPSKTKRYGSWAIGLFFAGTLGSLLLMILFPQQQQPSAMFGGGGLLLALVLGLMSWHERSGKLAVVATGVVFATLLAVFAINVFLIAPAKRGEMQARLEREERNALEQMNQRAARSSFSPVIECLLVDVHEQGTNKAIRLLTGELASPPAGEQALMSEWMFTNRMDLAVSRRGSQWSLQTAGLKLREASPGLWDTATVASVRNTLSPFPFLAPPGNLEMADQTYLMPEDAKLPWTLAFRTLEKDEGLMQVTGFTDNPRGVKVRYKLAQRAEGSMPPAGAWAGAQSLTFGSVVERTLLLDTGSASQWLDPETGLVVPGAPISVNAGEHRFEIGSAPEQALSVIPPTGQDRAQLVAAGISITPLHPAAEWWAKQPADLPEVAEASASQQGMVVPANKDQPPHTFVFKTRGGLKGLLQITGFTDNPRGVKLCYKLVQTATASSGSHKPKKPDRKFVRLVVDKAAMTFEGQPTTWNEVGTLLDKVPERKNTVLEYAVTSDQITVQQQNEWFGKCIALAHSLGFEYASFIGIHPLGSKGTPASSGGSTGATRFPVFGPVIERVLPLRFGTKRYYLQFHTGEFFRSNCRPDGIMSPGEMTREQIADAGGADAEAMGDAEHFQFLGQGCLFTRESSPDWEKTSAVAIAKEVQRATWITGVLETKTKDLPATWLFKTARGEAGILQLLEIVELKTALQTNMPKPHGVKLRYKLVQAAPSIDLPSESLTSPLASPATASP